MNRYILIIGDAWEHTSFDHIEADNLSEAAAKGVELVVEKNSKRYSPLYQLNGVITHTAYLDLMRWYK